METAQKQDSDASLMYNESVIPNGVSIEILATRCNSDPECWNDIDEADCGFNPYGNVALGKSMKNKDIHNKKYKN